MATPDRGNGVVSDTETSEKPVREQLQKASISKAGRGDPTMADEEEIADAEESETNGEDTVEDDQRGRLQKKRSYEESEGDQDQGSTAELARHHTRKRSRDSTVEEDELNNGQRKSGERVRDDAGAGSHGGSNGQPIAPADKRSMTPELSGDKRGGAAVEAMTSPKSKKSRLHTAAEEADDMPTAQKESSNVKDVPDDGGSSEKKAESSKDPAEQKPTAKVLPTNAFANTSASSPFTPLPGSKSPAFEPTQTSSSAFRASGFSSLSGSTTSGFGAIGKTSGGFGSGGGFAMASKSPPPVQQEAQSAKETEDETVKSASSSTFRGNLGQKSTFVAAGTGSSGIAFGSSASAFGKLGQSTGGFGGTGFGGLGGGSGLTSFASGKPSSTLVSSSKPAKTFGATVDEEAEAEEGGDGEDDSGFKSPLSQESDKQDERFYLQELETGEEDEVTEYSCRAKLYNFAIVADGKKEWKERGLGVVRLNVKKPAPGEEEEDDDERPRARLLMRAEGSHRVILNTPVKKEIKFGSPDGGQPQGGYVYFMGAVDGKEGLELLQLKIRQQFAVELHEKVTELQEAM